MMQNERQQKPNPWTEVDRTNMEPFAGNARTRSKCLHMFSFVCHVMQGQLPVLGQNNPNSGHAVAKKSSHFPPSAWQRFCMLLCFASEACRHTHLSSRYSYHFWQGTKLWDWWQTWSIVASFWARGCTGLWPSNWQSQQMAVDMSSCQVMKHHASVSAANVMSMLSKKVSWTT